MRNIERNEIVIIRLVTDTHINRQSNRFFALKIIDCNIFSICVWYYRPSKEVVSSRSNEPKRRTLEYKNWKWKMKCSKTTSKRHKKSCASWRNCSCRKRRQKAKNWLASTWRDCWQTIMMMVPVAAPHPNNLRLKTNDPQHLRPNANNIFMSMKDLFYYCVLE